MEFFVILEGGNTTHSVSLRGAIATSQSPRYHRDYYAPLALVMTHNMLPANRRLKKKRDMEILFKEGKFVAGKNILLRIWKIDLEKYPKRGYSAEDLKIAFVVGKKVSKSAVKRNRLKRQMREVVRLLLQSQNFSKGYHTAFVAKPSLLGTEYNEIETEMTSLLKKANLLR